MTGTRGAALAILLGGLAGCITPTAQTCGDLICPADALCVGDTRCVTHDAVAACDGIAPGGGCSVANQYGRCAQVTDGAMACEPAACGDGVIDAPLHEACDGDAAFAAQCVDLGYDLGLPACTAGCDLDPAPCTRFGWDVAVDAPISVMWTDGTVLAYERHDPDRLVVTGGGFALELAMTATALYGGGGRVVAEAQDGTVYDLTPAGPTVVAMPPNTPSPPIIAVDGAGALYAAGIGCTIFKEQLGWTTVHDDNAGSCTGLFTAGTRLFSIVYGDLVAEHVGSGPPVQLFRADAAIRSVRFAGQVAYVASAQSFSRWPGTGSDLTAIAYGDARSLAIAGTHAFAAFSDGRAVRWNGTSADPFTPPTAALADDGHGAVYSFVGPIYRYSGAMFGDLAPLPLAPSDEVVAAIATPDGDFAVASTGKVWVPDSAGDQLVPLQSFSTAIHALAGNSRAQLALATYDTSTAPQLQRRFGSGIFGSETIPGATAIDGLWMGPNQVVYAAGQGSGGGWLGFDQPPSGQWVHQDIPGCAFFAVDGRVTATGTRVVAAGECNGAPAIWELQVGVWTQIDLDASATATLRAVRVLGSGDVVATGDQLTRWQVGGAWRSSALVHGRAIAGDDADVWISGSFTPVQHWDGHAWSKMTTRPLGPIALAVTPSRVVMAGGAVGHVALLRD